MTSDHRVGSHCGFDQFHLSPSLQRAIEAAGYTTPRPIQEQTIPAALSGRDVLGLAQTGTGKTAAFALPILQRLLTPSRRGRRPGPHVLVVAPTRELALQIEEDFRALARFTDLRTVAVYGGISDRRQIQSLRRHPEIIVACPGRLLDLFHRGEVPLERIDTLVLDEADHMFDMGFLPDIRRILSALPDGSQKLLFAATMPPEIRKLANRALRQPVVVELEHSSPAKGIDHVLCPVAEKDKVGLLRHLVSREGFSPAIVFTRTKHRARRLAIQLGKMGHRAIALQGNMSQGQRDRAMQGFRERRFDILVATDVASRGIDVERVANVVNFDLPNTPEAYTHRIGRTGRAGQTGKAYSFAAEGDGSTVRTIEHQLGTALPRHEVEGFEARWSDTAERDRRSPWGRSGDGRRRPANRQRPARGDRRPHRGSGRRGPSRDASHRRAGPEGEGTDGRRHGESRPIQPSARKSRRARSGRSRGSKPQRID